VWGDISPTYAAERSLFVRVREFGNALRLNDPHSFPHPLSKSFSLLHSRIPGNITPHTKPPKKTVALMGAPTKHKNKHTIHEIKQFKFQIYVIRLSSMAYSSTCRDPGASLEKRAQMEYIHEKSTYEQSVHPVNIRVNIHERSVHPVGTYPGASSTPLRNGIHPRNMKINILFTNSNNYIYVMFTIP
jgi:hypothetical protein